MAKKKGKSYNYHNEWEHDYFFVEINNVCVCLICNSPITQARKFNISRHYDTNHKNYNDSYPLKSNLRVDKINNLKNIISGGQNMITRIVNKPLDSTIASLKICHLLAKKKKPFVDGELIKEAFILAGDTLFDKFKNKKDIIESIESIQLSRHTVVRRLGDFYQDINCQLKSDIDICVAFSLQFDESNDVMGTAQFVIFIRMVFSNHVFKEELLEMIPMHGRTRGEDFYNAFNKYVEDYNFPIDKLISITTDGCPSMVGRINGFVALCRNNPNYPEFWLIIVLSIAKFCVQENSIRMILWIRVLKLSIQ